jgi:hypothetical protein
LAGEAALGFPAGELDPPPPAWLGDEAAGADADEDAPPESAGVLAAGADADVAPDPVGVDELDTPEHPAMPPTRASAAAASSARLTRADEVMNLPLFGHAPKRIECRASPAREPRSRETLQAL